MDLNKLRAFDDMFQSEGWKYLQEEAKEELENLQMQIVHGDERLEQIYFHRGQMLQLNRMVELEDTLIAMVKAEQEVEANADIPL